MIDAELEVLVSAGILKQKGSGATRYTLDSLPSLPQPSLIDALAAMVEQRLPADTRGITVAQGSVNAQLGYALARTMELPLSVLYDVEGVGHLDGPLPQEGTLSLVSYVMRSPWLVREFTGLCKQRGGTVGSVVAIIDQLVERTTPPVQSVFSQRDMGH